MTGRVDIVWRIFEKIANVKVKVTGPNFFFFTFSGKFTKKKMLFRGSPGGWIKIKILQTCR